MIALLRAVGPGAARRTLLRLLGAALAGVGAELAGVALIGTAAWLITRAAEQPAIGALAVAIVAVRALALARGTLRYVERLASHEAALRLLSDLRAAVFAALTRRHRDGRDGEVLGRVVSDVDGVQDALLRCLLPAAVAAVVGCGGVGVAWVLGGAAAAAVLGVGVAVGALGLPILGYLAGRGAGGRLAAARARVAASTVDIVRGAADLLAYGAMPAALAGAEADARTVARLESRTGTVSAAVAGLAALVPGGTAVGVSLAVPGRGPVTVALALLAMATAETVVPLAAAAVRHAELRACLARVAALLASAPGERDRGHVPGRRDERYAVAHLRLRDVVVPGRLCVDELDLPPGARVAVVGPSGAGKSTLLAVLAGQLPPDTGQVDGHPPGVPAWRVASGILADAHVFHATVRENVTLGRPGLTDDRVREALRTAGLADRCDRLDDVVGEDGSRLSGGQRQRLLLARALIEAPGVLVLDEPTEGLDPATADEVLDAALKAAGARTVVVVTHREAHLDRFDTVVRLEGGRRMYTAMGEIPEVLADGGVRR